ncbi:MAG: hypothetical protein RIR49_681 [Actinomycetota bacterium]|jgi:hypothetical protein
MNPRGTFVRRMVPVLLIGMTAVGCGDGDEDDDTTTTTAEATTTSMATEGTVEGAGVDEIQVSATVSPDGVIAAAVLLAEGDVEQAIADGLVTVDEVDIAVRAMARGELAAWLVAAGG